MATRSSVFAWRLSGTGEPGGLPSMGLHRVGYESDLAAAAYIYSQLLSSKHQNFLGYFYPGIINTY